MGKFLTALFAIFGLGAATSSEAKAEPTPTPPGPKPKPEPDPTPAPVPPESDTTQPIGGDWLAELNAELQAAGVTNFTAEELTYLPKTKPKGRHDEPPRELWGNLVAVAKLAQQVRDLYGEPIWVSSAWRPKWYNDAVDGAPNSAHIKAGAVDLNVLPGQRTPERTKRLEQATAKVWLTDNTANGFGVYSGARTHIDVVNGRRKWGDANRVLGELDNA